MSTKEVSKLTDQEKVIPTTCASHCGGTCVLKAHVKDGIITRFETDEGEEPQMRACWRGRTYRQRVYAPERLKFPMKRVGKRGEEKFERITWDEALDTVAKQLLRVRDIYGPASIVLIWAGADFGQVHNFRQVHKVLSRLGGYTKTWGAMSFQGGVSASQATFNAWRTSNSRDDLLNSRLIILWGWNPANTVCGNNTTWYLAQAREMGAKIVAIDPRYTDTVAVLADKWIPIYPGTDGAMLVAMAYTMIQENLQDQVFLSKYTIGFDRFREYVLGIEDGLAKTPVWAENITGVPAATIESLAREYATTKPAALLAGIAPGRTAYGEQYHRAASTLAAMTGNIGIHGGDAAGRVWETANWYPYEIPYGFSLRPEDGSNPLHEGKTGKGRSAMFVPSGVHHMELPDFFIKGKDGGYPADPKLVYIVNCDYLNQLSNINRIKQASKKLDFIVTQEQFMTPTAKLADIILPTTTFLERNELQFGVGTPYYGFVNKVIEPMGECKSHLDIARELAAHLGITNFGNETDEELLRKEIAVSEIPDYEAFKKTGIYKFKYDEPYIAFKKQIEDPVNNPFDTPSGKIEIYSQQWADQNNAKLPPVAKYIETWESRNDPMAKKYPLQLVTTHFKRRSLSQFETLPWLRELQPQAMLISTIDAEARGIKDGDKVMVLNDRGKLIITAKVTERIMPGVIDIPHGAWYDPDENGVDKGGNPNVLIKDQYSPSGAFPYNTCLVQVQKT